MEQEKSQQGPLYFDAPISQFNGIKPLPLETQPTVRQVLAFISQDERIKQQIHAAREVLKEELLTNKRDEKGKILLLQYDTVKKTLPGVTFTGTFKTRTNKGFVFSSGFLSFDVDFIDKYSKTPVILEYVQKQATIAYDILKNDKFTAAVFFSVSGTGLKGLVKIPNVESDAEFKCYFRAYQQYLQKTYQIELDSLPDISRLCFLSHHENLFVNENSKIFTQQKKEESPPQPTTSKNQIKDSSLRAAIAVLKRHGIPAVSRSVFVGLCALFKRLELSYEEFDAIMQKSPGYNQAENFKIWNTVDAHEERENPRTVSTLIKYARQTNKQLFADLRKEYTKNPDSEQTGEVGLATLIERKLLTKYDFRLNVITGNVDVMNENYHQMQSIYTDSVVRSWMLDQGFNKPNQIGDAIKKIAFCNQYHPIEEYFKKLRWDNKDRFSLAGNFFKDNDNIFKYIFQAWCVGAVRRVFTGHHHQAIIFVGKQGKGKSFLTKWLCPNELKEFHLEMHVKPDTNDSLIRVTENFIWEIGEVKGTTQQVNINLLKLFISLEYSKFRRAHAPYDERKRCLASFIGTVNPDGAGFLNDPTGERRWWPIELTEIAQSFTQELDAPQLWAQAFFLYKEHGDAACNVPEEVQKIITDNIENEFSTENPLESLFLRIFDFTENDDDFLDTMEILVLLAANGFRRNKDKIDAMDLAISIKKLMSLGYPIIKKRTGGKRGYCGLKIKPDAKEGY